MVWSDVQSMPDFEREIVLGILHQDLKKEAEELKNKRKSKINT